jgi:hypothetical protein
VREERKGSMLNGREVAREVGREGERKGPRWGWAGGGGEDGKAANERTGAEEGVRGRGGPWVKVKCFSTH